MDQDLTEYLDPEIREPLRRMLAEMPAMNFDDLPAARENSRKQMEEMRKLVPPIPGLKIEDRTIPGPENEPDIMVRIYRPQNFGTPPHALFPGERF